MKVENNYKEREGRIQLKIHFSFVVDLPRIPSVLVEEMQTQVQTHRGLRIEAQLCYANAWRPKRTGDNSRGRGQ